MTEPLVIFFGLLQQFTGTGGGANHPIVHFGIAAIFWALLLMLTHHSAGRSPEKYHRMLMLGFGLALFRELFMIAVKVLRAYGVFTGEQLHVVFPPLEHALSNVSLIIVAGAFLIYLTGKSKTANRYIVAGVGTIVAVYLSSFWYWAQHILANPTSKFGQTWPELAFRSAATFWLVVPIVLLFRYSSGWQRNVVSAALGLFAMNEFLKIVDALTGEVNEPVYAAIRHALYMAALPLLAYLYSREQSERIQSILHGLEERVSERTSELEGARVKLERLSQQDGLTGLSNRRHFDERLESEWRRCLRQQRPISILLIDLDHFKSINDTYGHSAGDACLVAVASTLAQFPRREGDLAARYGGEEFALLLSGSEETAAAEIGEAVRQKISELEVALNGQVLRLTCSIGLVTGVPTVQSDALTMVNASDAALYRAKGEGRNRVCAGTLHSVAANAAA